MATKSCMDCGVLEKAEGMSLWSTHRHDKKTDQWTETDPRCDDCEMRRRHRAWRQTGRIDDKLIMKAMYIAPRACGREYALAQDGDPRAKAFSVESAIELLDISDRIRAKVKELDQRVWFGGLQAYSRAARQHGHSYLDADIKALFCAMAGRAMLTLSDPAERYDITVITDESSTSSRMGWQSIHATEAEALGLIDCLMAKWPVVFRPDGEVSLL